LDIMKILPVIRGALATVLSLCCCFLVLSGCSASSQADPVGGDEAPASTESEPSKAPSQESSVSVGSRAADLSVAELKASLAQENPWLLVDVRTPGEFSRGHVPGAINVPLGQLEGRLAELESGRGGLFVVCQSGGRSAAASERLVGWGFTQVTNISGGTGAWIAASYPVETPR